MKKKNIKSEKLRTFFLDIFFGGREYKTTNDKAKTPFPLVTVALSALTTVLVLALIFSLIKVSDLSAEIASLKRQTVSLSAKENSLKNELDHRYSFAEIIETAKELGYSENGGRIIYIESENEKDSSDEENEEEEKEKSSADSD